MQPPDTSSTCATGRGPDLAGVERVALRPDPAPADYRAAMTLAEAHAQERLGDCMLLSWYDRDRDFEAPQHVSECSADDAVRGYIHYALNRGATLRIDVDDGRFVFFYRDLGG